MLLAPFPYFGGKRTVVTEIWERFGSPRQYIEPFCGSAAMLLGAPKPCSLEVICDGSGFIANFWRAVKNQPDAVAKWADYPVSHIDLGARHVWLMAQRERLGAELRDADWPGDAKVAGWWLWGQCSWIGSGWCDWFRQKPGTGKPDTRPHISDTGQGIQAIGQVPHISEAGQGIHAIGQVPHISNTGMDTSSGRVALQWLGALAARLERVRVIHGDWSRCLNHHHGKDKTAVFLDPPYRGHDKLYGSGRQVADDVAAWAKEHPHLRIALCGHVGEHKLPKWSVFNWKRNSPTMGSTKSIDQECIWFSPGCMPAAKAKGVTVLKRIAARAPARSRKIATQRKAA